DAGRNRGPAHRGGPGTHRGTDRRGGRDPWHPSQHPGAEDPGVRPVTDIPGSPPVRVEQALRLLPQLEVLGPLRSRLPAVARAHDRTQWGSSGPYLTVGKRGVQPADLRQQMSAAVLRVTEHLTLLFECYLEALEFQQRRDGISAVGALLRA